MDDFWLLLCLQSPATLLALGFLWGCIVTCAVVVFAMRRAIAGTPA